MSLVQAWREQLRREMPFAAELRHTIHTDPRLTGEEEDTARLLAVAIGAGDGQRIATTGRLIDITRHRQDTPAIALRTELDALPLVERSGVAWASTNQAMHACGHDVHMAALAAVCRSAQRLDLPVPLVALLQPREEGANSGARDVVAEGWMSGISDVIAAHLQPQLTAGVVSATSGSVNAGMDEMVIDVTGRGGHSGYPHTVDDSVLALAAIVVALQQVPARRVDPVTGVACMVNTLAAGDAPNVVPGFASAQGTIRTMTEADRIVSREAVTQIVEHVAAAHGCTGVVHFSDANPVLVNDVELAAEVWPLLIGLGHQVSSEFRSFGSDDFAYYGELARCLMMFVGTGDDGGGLHDATYVPDDSYIGLVADALISGYCAAVTSRSG